MERNRLTEHLIDHYVARDQFRHTAHHLLQRHGLPTATAFLTNNNGNRLTPRVSEQVVHSTRVSLKRCKHVTLDHLHNLLHNEAVLDEDEHVHDGEDLFNYVIQEDADAPVFGLT